MSLVTRARYSVAFVYKTKYLPSNDIGVKWMPTWNDWNAVLRHTDNSKWYGLIMEVGRDKLGQGIKKGFLFF